MGSGLIWMKQLVDHYSNLTWVASLSGDYFCRSLTDCGDVKLAAHYAIVIQKNRWTWSVASALQISKGNDLAQASHLYVRARALLVQKSWLMWPALILGKHGEPSI